MTDERSAPELMEELEDLRARLAEAEDVVRAIRFGQVDAVVVAGDHGKQIYTLFGADRLYRQFIETMSEGAVILSADGTILYGNNRLAEMLGRPLNQVLGTGLRDYLPPADRQALEAIPQEAGGTPIHREFSLMAGDGRQVPVYMSASHLPNEGEGTLLVLTDLTEQRRHAQIAAAERLARLILEQAAEVIIVCDQQGQVTRVSEAAQSLCDGSPLFRPFAEVFPLRTSVPGSFHLAPVLQGETIRDVEVFMNRHGEKLVLILNAGPLTSGNEILGCVVTLTDITERERAEAALRASADEFRTMFELASIGMAQADPRTGQWLRVNQKMCATTGYTADEMLRMHISNITHPEDRQEDAEAFQRVVRGEAADYHLEKRYLRKDGAVAWVNVNMTVIRDAAGQPTRTMATIEDITERKRAEAERERLAMAVDQVAETVVVTDTQGCILYVNPAFQGTTGYSPAEALGKNSRILKSGEQDPDVYRELWETICAGKTWSGRLINKKKSGELFTEEVTISPVRDAAGAIVSYVAVKRDITKDLALEAQLLQSQRMEGIGRLAGGVAHDFNNILSVILSSARFALESLKEGDPLREDILDIEKGGQRAAALTRQLLAFSRKQVLQPVSLDLNRVIGEMEKMLRRIIGEDVDLVQVLAPDLGLTRADPGQVEQVLMNLVVNARDAMPEGGKLTIETANVTLDEKYTARHAGAKPGPHVMVAITDSGVGMDERTMARIFEPFFTTKGLGKGSGLGLSTVYGIVKQSGGSIFVYSEIGLGTTFKVFLPREESPATLAVRPPRPSTRVSRGETILVVEDDESLRSIAKRILVGAGYKVLTAANGGEGLLACEQHAREIHLVLTDVVMPQMSGRVFADRLAMVQPGMKVLFMSGYTDDAIVHHGVLEPGTHFIGKPFTQADLRAKVRDVLDGVEANG